MKKARDSFSFKDNLLSILIEIKKLFTRPKLQAKIKEKNYNVVGRLGMYHTVIDITDENINVGDEVSFEVSPMYINSEIRREYI